MAAPLTQDEKDKLDNNDNTGQLSASFSFSSQQKLKEYLKDKSYLFYCPSMKQIAIDIQKQSNGCVILGDISWELFNDGFPNLRVNNAFNIRWAHVAFLADLSDPRNIFEQYAVMCALPRYLAKSVKIFVGYFPTGTMERVSEYGEIATAKTLARLLSSIPTGQHGPVQICICDIHTLQNHFYFSDNILVRLETCTGLIKKEMKQITNCSVAFPDEGAHKRFHQIFKNWPQIICTKIRDGNKRIVQLKEGEVQDRNVIIIDDLVQTGGTLAKCGQLLRKKGCKSVSCFVTHSVFPNESWHRFCKDGDSGGLFDTFYVTDTIPQVTDLLKNHPPFKVLSIASVYLPVIQDDEDAIGIEFNRSPSTNITL
eukprot:80129_1